MTGSRPDPTPDDDLDPTGVRALLANLPDPGPMPEELVARISHSLELEQRRRTAAAAGAAETAEAEAAAAAEQPGGPVVSLTAERARRRPGRTVLWLGGAAAVAMVATVSVNQLVGDGDTNAGVSAQYPGASDSGDSGGAADDASDGGAELDTPGDVAAEAPPVTADESAEEGTEDAAGDSGGFGVMDPARTGIVGLDGTVELTATGWADQVSALLASDPGERDLDDGEWRECLTSSSVSLEDPDRLLLGDARWDDEAARLLVAQSPSDDRAWVLTPDCREILSGPVTLP